MRRKILALLPFFLFACVISASAQNPTPTPKPILPQRLSLTTSDGFALVGEYLPPASPDKPGLVMLHQVGRDQSSWAALAKKFQALGFGTRVYDARGHGKSNIRNNKKAPWSMFALSGEDNDWNKMLSDLSLFINFLKDKQKVEPNRVVLIGASIGGNIALKFAAKNKDIKGIILLSPGLSYHDVKTESAAAEWDGRPCLFVSTKGDTYSFESCNQLKQIMDKKAPATPAAKSRISFITRDRSTHGTDMLGDDLDKIIINWIQDLYKK